LAELAKKKTSLHSWFLTFSQLEADGLGRAGIGGLLAAACSFAICSGLDMGQTVIAYLKDVWADVSAHSAANTQIMINTWIHQISSSVSL
jgi:hypothetical protein